MDFVTQKHDNSVVAFSESDMSDSSESHLETNPKSEVKETEETKKKDASELTKTPDYLCSSEEEDLLFPVGRNRKRHVVDDSMVEGWCRSFIVLVESSSAMFIEDPVIQREDSLVVEEPSHSAKASSVPSAFLSPLFM